MRCSLRLGVCFRLAIAVDVAVDAASVAPATADDNDVAASSLLARLRDVPPSSSTPSTSPSRSPGPPRRPRPSCMGERLRAEGGEG